MFKSKKKKQQQKKIIEEPTIPEVKQYQILDDIPLAHDFRSSTILPHLNTNIDVAKIEPHSPSITDSSKYYEQIAAWRHEKNQNRYSNGLFGGKHRGRPKLEHNNRLVSEEQEIEQETYLYEPQSEEEENYFFQDFSAENKDTKKSKRRVVKKTSTSQQTKPFNLSSFAQDLHDNRLSVIQSRQSKIVMTEEDERQLEKLLEKKRFESSESLLMPPLPSFSLVKSQSTPSRTSIAVVEEEEIVPQLSREHSATHSFTSTSSTVSNKEVSEKLEIDDEHILDLKPANSFSSTQLDRSLSNASVKKNQLARVPSFSSIKSKEQTLTRSPSIASIRSKDQRLMRSPSMASIINQDQRLTRSPSATSQLKKSSSIASIDPLKRSISTASIKQNMDQFNRSNSTLNIKRSPSNASMNEPIRSNSTSNTKSTFETIEEEQQEHQPKKSTSTDLLKPIITNEAPVLKTTSSRSLFGSLRQVSRSKTTTSATSSFKGLVRNLSQASHRPSSTNNNSGMSRAAMAVLQHEQKKDEEERPEGKQDEEEKPRANSRLISQLISKAARHKKNTKIVNMNEDKGRAKVVRRTIIYVQPDSLNGALKAAESKASSEDEASKEYVTATKVVRQTSVRKRVVTDRQQDKKRWQLQSMDESEFLSVSDEQQPKEDYLEGVELREMSDGSVVWGIVKQQGNRKSFFAPNQNNIYEHIEDELAPPPIPKRSPKRQADKSETTDIYYSDEMTLPNLLKMMQQETHPGDELSVDDQLDEMMRILTSQ
ncbi:hypothetical protein G6F46_006465 [Rhizopus delemar]|uniref:Uncharacterized protein n=3 Tax=Rhizopus TaxID=4842 RepID=I1BHW4_RHIO9|nr:hypothetical protein RO3G_00498 [Rhizopus delemar RA 99-880]KAG1457239.1 hypothetical protein G6F55_006050 [Rhizopus delemar]KAG1541296.1 hypothetical protein G6F51_007982 [Rhizopus arrhizus]KAG1495397.1 hypothetical protein G6F54_007204 [Rhizopus delemar]KAG1509294.1 hypothetical protein G6F53_007557 [Rhizopus delemar]|eukprot:EIE75794.1 hypothetical protein RO3G_00498 [Rhizopus delemar RA 99-880]